jgi:hypothetical protein
MLKIGLETRTTDISALASARKAAAKQATPGAAFQVIRPFHAPTALAVLKSGQSGAAGAWGLLQKRGLWLGAAARN